MNLYCIPNLVVSIYTLALGIVAIRANPSARINKFFFILSLVCFSWLFGYGLMYLLDDYQTSAVIGRIGHISAVLLVPAVYWFMLATLGDYRKKIDFYAACASTMIAFIAACMVYTSTIYFTGISRRYWGYYPVGGPYMFAYTLWSFIAASRCVFVLNAASKKAAKELRYEDYLKFKYYALSLVIFVFAAVDFLPKFGLDIYPFGFIFVGAFSSLITYAIIRHRLFDVRIVIRRSFVYSLLITTITFIYLSIILLSEYFFRSFFGYASVITAILASSVIAFTFNPLRLRLQLIIDRNFFLIDPEKIALENVKLKEAVQEQDRMKAVATLAAGMAHEIKNPLTSIKTFAEYLPKKYDDPEFREKFSRIVVDEVDRVNNIVRQLLEFSKPAELELKSVLVAPLMEETLGLLNSNMVKKNISVIKQFDVYAIVLADYNQLKQAFLNIFLNAIQSIQVKGEISVTARTEPDGVVRVSVADTGCGMSDEQLKHAFDPFYTTKEEGTGLGLAIVHSIITKHGGKIEISSRPGQGATVTVLLKSQS